MRAVPLLLVFALACTTEHPGPAPLPDAAAGVCPAADVQCAVHDNGWNVQCSAGIVTSDDLSTVDYCALDHSVACTVGGPGTAVSRLYTCANGCADVAIHFFETFDEYSRFDAATLCAP